MPGPGQIILILKIAVIAVTLLLAWSLVVLWRGNYWLHGRINLAFFVLTLTALLGLEVIARILQPDIFVDYLDQKGARTSLWIHLGFAFPSALLMPLMLYTGLSRQRRWHIALAIVFLALWTGTFITGVFYLPHEGF